MPVTLVVENAPADLVAVRVDPLSELTAYLHAVLHGDHHPRAAAARERFFGTGAEAFLTRFRRFAPFLGPVRPRFLFPLSIKGPATPSLDARLGELQSLPIAEFGRLSARCLVSESRTFGDDDPLATPQQFLKEAERASRAHGALAHELLDDPEAVRASFTALLEDAQTGWFHAEWESCRAELVRSADVVRSDIARNGPSAIASVSSTAVVLPDPTRIVFDKINRVRVDIAPYGVVLVPSLHTSPHLIVKSDPLLPPIVQYPVGEQDVESLDLVKRRLHALRDDSRIEICRQISRVPMTTLDLAIELQSTEPQVSRHLRALREAGLVHRTQRGRLVYYTLDTAVLQGLGPALIAAMLR